MSPIRASLRRFLVPALTALTLAIMLPAHALGLANTVANTNWGGGGETPCTGYKNTDARTATGYHYTYTVPDPYSITYFLATVHPMGTVTATPIYDGTRLSGYDVVVTGISVETDSCVTVDNDAVVTGGTHPCNVAIFSDIQFTYPDVPFNVGTGAAWQWSFLNDFVARGPSHGETFKLYNRDASRTITFSSLAFSQAASVGATSGERTQFATNGGGSLAPGESLLVNLTVPMPSGTKNSVVFVDGTMNYTGTGGGSGVSFAVVHEEAFNENLVPGASKWGLVALAIVMAALAGLFLVVRSRRSTVDLT